MGQPVVHFEICGKDATKSSEFYAKLFDWKIKRDEVHNYHEAFPGGQGGINGGISQARDHMPPYLTFYVQVDDLQKYLTRAESLGGKTILPPMPIAGVGSIAMFSDLDGHCIGLFKPGA